MSGVRTLRLPVAPGVYVEAPLDPAAVEALRRVMEALRVDEKLPGEGVVFEVARRSGGVHLVKPTARYAWSRRDVEVLEEAYRCTARGVYGWVNPAARCPGDEELQAARVRVERRVAEWLAAIASLGYRPTREARLEGVVWVHREGHRIVPLYPRRYLGTLDYRVARRELAGEA